MFLFKTQVATYKIFRHTNVIFKQEQFVIGEIL